MYNRRQNNEVATRKSRKKKSDKPIDNIACEYPICSCSRLGEDDQIAYY